jgi:8-oxo-dGTP pyrophosphatase MutT (NUDIX family)
MAFADSYLGRLRQKIGSELVLMPGAMVVLQDDEGRVLVTRRTDNGHWCLPAGAAEVGGSFAATALTEVSEEIGIALAAADLIPFGSLSAAESHTIEYPNGDLTHCFALLFVVRGWSGDPRPDGTEVDEARFVDIESLPEPMMDPAREALRLFGLYLESGRFQLG